MDMDELRRSTVSSEINVTPMVDVMLVLLIIFMVVTPSLLQGFQGQLPTGENLKERESDDKRVEMGIDLLGNYYLNKKRIDKENAVALLTQQFNMRPQDKVLFLKADARLKYSEIMEAMRIAREAGARVTALITDRQAGLPQKEEGAR
jgi:biopolymer transport protein ExbD